MGGDNTIYLPTASGTVAAFDAATGKLQNQDVVYQATDGFTFPPVVTYGYKGLLSIDENGVYLLGDKQQAPAPLLANTQAAFGHPDAEVIAAAVAEDGTIFVCYSIWDECVLSRYTPQDEPIDMVEEILVWSLHDDSIIRMAITQMRLQYPDIAIKLDIPSEADGSIPENERIQILNTEILAGNGLVLNGLPVNRLVELGILADINKYVHTEDVFETLLELFRDESVQYAVPAGFSLPLLVYEDESVSSLDELLEKVYERPMPQYGERLENESYAQSWAGEDRPQIWFNSYDELFDVLWCTAAPIVIANNEIQDVVLEELLLSCESLCNAYGLMQPEEYGDSFNYSMHKNIIIRYTGSSMEYIAGRAATGAFTTGEVLGLYRCKQMNTLNPEIHSLVYSLALLRAPGSPKHCWEYTNTAK